MTPEEVFEALVKSDAMKVRPTPAIRQRYAGIKCKCGTEVIADGPTVRYAKESAALDAQCTGWTIAEDGEAVCCSCKGNS